MVLNLQSLEKASLAFSAAMLLACTFVVSNAFAEDQVRRETVKFQDLNTDTPAGVEALYIRIHLAAKRVCSQTDPVLRYAEGACARMAEARAIGDVNLPLLTAYYRKKTGDRTERLTAKR